MFRLVLRHALLLTMLVAVFIFIIRAQPYDDSELRNFLTPHGCPAPCFMGIRPGEVNVDEAIDILESHEWVARAGENYVSLMQAAVDYGVSPLTATLVWEWTVNKPDWISADRSSYLVVGDRKILAITLQTTIPLGDVLITYGIPDNAQLVRSESSFLGHTFSYNVWYPAHCMEILAGGAGLRRYVYQQPVQIQIQQTDSLEPDTLPNSNCG